MELRIETAFTPRRDSFASVPRFFHPKTQQPHGGAMPSAIEQLSDAIVRRRVDSALSELVLSAREWEQLLDAVRIHAYDPGLSGYQRTILRRTVVKSGIVAIDRMLDDHVAVSLSFDDFVRLRTSPQLTPALAEKLQQLLPAQCFLMLAVGSESKLNGFTLLEYLFRLQRSLSATQLLSTRASSTASGGTLTELEYTALIHELIERAAKSHLDIDSDFLEYYELICTRALLLPHDAKKRRGLLLVDDVLACAAFLAFFALMDPTMHALVSAESNRFHPSAVRNIHRQYVQLDADKNGMLSAHEMAQYGKKKAFNPLQQQPTHDLTPAFIAQVFAECPTFPPDDEMDYKAYIDFTLLMADTTSDTSLRFLWRCLDVQKQGYLDVQKQGYLDTFTLDYFLRDLEQKIRMHGEDNDDCDAGTTVERLQAQVFDIVAPTNAARITWKDWQRCGAGHTVARILIDYVAFRAHEDAGGKLPSPSPASLSSLSLLLPMPPPVRQ